MAEGTITTESPGDSEEKILAKCGAKPSMPSGYQDWVSGGKSTGSGVTTTSITEDDHEGFVWVEATEDVGGHWEGKKADETTATVTRDAEGSGTVNNYTDYQRYEAELASYQYCRDSYFGVQEGGINEDGGYQSGGGDVVTAGSTGTQIEGSFEDERYKAEEGYQTYKQGRDAPQAEYIDMDPAALAEQVTLGNITEAQAAQIGQAQLMQAAQVGTTAVTGAAQVGPSTATQIAQVGAATGTGYATIAPTSATGAAQLGTTATTGAAQVAPTAVTGAAQVGSVTGTGFATIEQQKQAEFRQRQMDLVSTLEQQAAGTGPSVSGNQFKIATDRNIAQQQALAASARGGDAAMARRTAAQNVSDFGQQAAQGAAQGRLEEQAVARAQLGELITSGRGADIGLAQAQASLEQAGISASSASQNARTLLQAQFDQAGMTDTAAAQNATAALQAQFMQQGMSETAAAQNASMIIQAQMEQSALEKTAAAENQMKMAQAELEQAGINATAAAENARTLLQAQLAQTGMSQTAAAANATTLLQASLVQQGMSETAAAQNAAILMQAQLTQEAAARNMEATNAFTIKQGEFEQQVNLTNAEAENIKMLQQGQMDQQQSLANQDALNKHAEFQAKLDQGITLINIQAELQQMQLDDAGVLAHLQMLTNMTSSELSAQLQREAIAAGVPPSPGFGDYVLAAAPILAGILIASDKKLKKKIKSPSEGWLQDFMDEESDEDKKKKEKNEAIVDSVSKAASSLRRDKEYTVDSKTGKRTYAKKSNLGLKAVDAAAQIVGAYTKKKSADEKRSKLKDKKDLADAMLMAENAPNYVEEQRKKLEDSQSKLTASDINLKKDIGPGADKLDDFLAKIEPYEYEYKDTKDGEGKFISPMAQDLEKSEEGAKMVIDTGKGKMVNYQRGLGTIVAALAHLDNKIEELKKGKKKGKR